MSSGINDDASSRRVAEVMAAVWMRPAEAQAVAVLGEAGLFADAETAHCVRDLPHPHVNWLAASSLVHELAATDPRADALRRSLDLARTAFAVPPETLEDLQVAIELDQPDSQVIAAWRDAYAEDLRTPNPYHHHIGFVLDQLGRRGACWDCGRPAETTINDMLVCTSCKENS